MNYLNEEYCEENSRCRRFRNTDTDIEKNSLELYRAFHDHDQTETSNAKER